MVPLDATLKELSNDCSALNKFISISSWLTWFGLLSLGAAALGEWLLLLLPPPRRRHHLLNWQLALEQGEQHQKEEEKRYLSPWAPREKHQSWDDSSVSRVENQL